MTQKKKGIRIASFLFALLVLFQTVDVSAAQQTLPSGLNGDQLEEEIDSFVEEHEDTTAGMAVAVFDNSGELVKSYYGYVDKENQIPVEAESVFEWGSTTKLLVWVSVMQLYEQGELDLNEDIRTYLPEGFLTNLSYDTPVTMTNLMNHNAGFQEVYTDLFVKDLSGISSLEDVLKVHQPEQIYEPGTVAAYSNWGVALAAYVVENVSGMSFSDYVHQNIFEPLGMEHSAVYMDLSDNSWVQEKRQELQCYTTTGELIPDCYYYITMYPAGMCTSTLDDFETFARALLDENCVLFEKSETRAEMFTPTAYFGDTDIPSNCHGFWMIPFGVQTLGHGGNTAGCSSYLLLDLEDGIGAVVMTNQSGESIYNSEMMGLIFGSYDRSNYTAENELPSGIYRPGRTVRKGPFKILSMSYCTVEEDEAMLWMVDEIDGLQKVVYSYGDYLEMPTAVMVLELGLVLLWLAAFLFSLISLLVRLIAFIVRKIRKKEAAVNHLRKWSMVAALLQIVSMILLVASIVCVSAYLRWNTYFWIFVVFGILTIAMIVMSVYGIVKNRGKQLEIRQKVFHVFTIGFLVVTIANILYWNLFMFWM
ncbi:MAG: beta-lactamase family protein [Lachnospiraceae bacterium]|nr:beta-lactamase family protein [Lachnospiraceae bacterium]